MKDYCFKDSGVEWLGKVPEHWIPARLRYFLDTSPSKTEVRGIADDRYVSFVPMESVGEQGGLDLSETKEVQEVSSGYTYFRDGDVVVAKITPCFENGKGALARDLRNGIGFGTTELHVLRAGQQLDELFLFYVTVSHPFRQLGEATMYGAGGQKRVPDDFIQNLRWPIPPLPEQRAIAAFLDRETGRIDALIEKKQRLIERLEEKRTALISHTVTKGLDPSAEMKDSGVEWLGEIPEHWSLPKLSHVFENIGSGTTPKSGDTTYYGGNTPWVTTSELREREIFETKKYVTEAALEEYTSLKIYPEGTLLIAMYGATIGRLGVLGVPATINQACCALARSKEVEVDLVYYMLRAFRSEIVTLSYGGGQPNISQETVASIRMPLPPPSEQGAITAFLDRETESIDALIDKVKDGISRLQEYRTALISAAVTGKIDVRDAVSPAEVAA